MTAPAAYLEDLHLALRATVEAAAHVRRDFGDHGRVRHKGPDQPVTEADLAVDRELRERLGAARPEYGWLSEETKDDRARLERARVWIVDPIDGTLSFVAGLPEFVISVGLAEDGIVVVGVLHNPLTGELYWAVRDAGAYGALMMTGGEHSPDAAAGALLRCDDLEELVAGPWGRFTIMRDRGAGAAPVSVLVSRSEMDAGALDVLPADWRRIRRGSTAYKMAGVAVGTGEAYLSRGAKREWDVCAAALLVQEAGGVVSDLDGRPYRFNRDPPEVHGVVAARERALHDRLLELVRALPPGDGASAAEEEE